MNLIELDVESLQPASVLRFETTLSTQGLSGVIFDQYGPERFKFVGIVAETDQVVIGHHTERHGWVFDAVAQRTIEAGTDYDLRISAAGTTVSVSLDGQALLGHVYTALVVDGGFGLFTHERAASFDSVSLETNDEAVLGFAFPTHVIGNPSLPESQIDGAGAAGGDVQFGLGGGGTGGEEDPASTTDSTATGSGDAGTMAPDDSDGDGWLLTAADLDWLVDTEEREDESERGGDLQTRLTPALGIRFERLFEYDGLDR
jgi:hypothetical protein